MKETNESTANRPFRLLKYQIVCLVLTGLFCFVPDRFLGAALLSIFLMVFLMVVTQTSSNSIVEQPLTDSQANSFEKINNAKEIVSSPSDIAGVQQSQTIMRLVEKKPGFRMHFSTTRLRSRNEMNDEFLEGRIRTLFEDIRDADNSRYRKGLLEIQHLLELRQKSLKGLTPTNKIS